jgi:hypothetical protein
MSFSPIGLAFRFPIRRDRIQQCFDRGAGEGLGEGLREFWSSHQLRGIGRQQFAGIEKSAPRSPTPGEGRVSATAVQMPAAIRCGTRDEAD